MALTPIELVRRSLKLSSLPNVYFKINAVLNDPNSSFADIAEVIKIDVSLSARLMKIVNSAFYGYPAKIDTITHAVSIIGTWQLRDLALSTTILSAFKGVPEKHISMDSFWRHSITCGIAARLIAIQKGDPNPERLFLAGILHDIGRLILLENLPEKGKIIMERFQSGNTELYKLEKEILGFDHTDIGAALMDHWNLPENLKEVIAYHHNPIEAPNFGYQASIINLADNVAKCMQSDENLDELVRHLNPESWEKVGLKDSFLPLLWNRIDSQYNPTIEAVIY
jgi:putative nucleotidyltransferase with HDIG domain